MTSPPAHLGKGGGVGGILHDFREKGINSIKLIRCICEQLRIEFLV